MTKNELITQLNWFQENSESISSILYFVFEGETGFILKKVDVENDLQNKITSQFVDYLNNKFLNNEDLSFMGLSETDDRKNVSYYYDFDNEIDSLSFMEDLIIGSDINTFNSSMDNIDELFGYATVIGNENFKVSTFKKHSPLDFVKRDRRLYIFPSQERFKEMETDGFILNKGFDFMKLNDNLIVNKIDHSYPNM